MFFTFQGELFLLTWFITGWGLMGPFAFNSKLWYVNDPHFDVVCPQTEEGRGHRVLSQSTRSTGPLGARPMKQTWSSTVPLTVLVRLSSRKPHGWCLPAEDAGAPCGF